MGWMWIEFLPICLVAMLVGIGVGCFLKQQAFLVAFAASYLLQIAGYVLARPYFYFDPKFLSWFFLLPSFPSGAIAFLIVRRFLSRRDADRQGDAGNVP